MDDRINISFYSKKIVLQHNIKHWPCYPCEALSTNLILTSQPMTKKLHDKINIEIEMVFIRRRIC